MALIRLFCLMYFPYLVISIPWFECPSLPLWNFHAGVVCNKTTDYWCMWDTNKKAYKENCGGTEFQMKGYRRVFSGGTTRFPCSPDKFQPFMYSTNGNYECVYKKSTCNEIGQIIYDDGTTTSDRRCRCNYTAGYVFLQEPEHLCYCEPVKEDCSCVKKTCPVNHILDPEYKCRSISKLKVSYNCESSILKPFQTEPAIVLVTDTSRGPEYSISTTAAVIVVLLGVLLCLGLAIILYTLENIGGLCAPKYIYMGRSTDELPLIIRGLQQKEVDNWKHALKTFVPTRASAAVKESIRTNQCVVITGPPGCGKTVTANYVILYMTESEGYDLMLVCDINDTIRYSKPKGKQLLFIDDIFGKHFIEEHNRDWWGKQNQRVQILLSRNKDLKLIATCRSYVYNLIDDRCLLPFIEICFLSEGICLNISERRSIGHSYIGDEINGLGDKVLMEFDFFPQLCYYCSVKTAGGFEEVVNPRMYIKYEIDQLFKHLDINFIIFSLIVILGNSIKIDLLTNENHKDNDKLNFLFREVGLKSAPSKQLLLKYLVSLKGSFVVEKNTMYKFKSEKLFNGITFCISKYIMKSLLKYGKWSVLKDRFTLDQFSKYRATNQCVSIPPRLDQLYFDRLLMDIKSGLFWDVFLDTNNNLPEFRNLFLDYLRDNFTCKDFKEDTNKSTVLHAVADQGYDDYVKFFADLDRSRVNMKDNNENTPLHLAAIKGHKAVVEVLLKRKGFFDATNKKGNTPLHLACAGGYVETVVSLLSKKAAIKQNPFTLDTALHLVCNNGHINLALILLQKNAKVNVSDQKGLKPLHLACRKGHIEICKLLLSHDANIDCVDNKRRTALHHACELNKLDVVKLLLEQKANLNIDTLDGKKNPIHIVCEKGYLEITTELLKENVQVDKGDEKGNTPLYLAAMNGHSEIVNLLLLKHADINFCNNGMNSPLHAATSHGHTGVVECLLEYNADKNCVNKETHTPLHIACQKRHTDIVELLLKCKDVEGETVSTSQKVTALNMKDKYGRTPLHIACENGRIPILKLLLDQGVNTECLDSGGLNAIYIACREGFSDILRLLLKHTTNVNTTDRDLWTPLYVACYENRTDIAKILIENNADVKKANKDGDTPLHQIATSGNDSLTKLLVTYGANINQKNNLGETPLWKSAINGHKSVTQYLVQHGAETDISDSFGNSLETVVRRINNDDHVEIVDILLGENETAL